MPATSRRQRLARLERRWTSSERWVAARLQVQDPDGEKLFDVGGCWDTVAGRYVDRPCRLRIVKLQPSQVPAGRAIGKYLAQRLAGDDERVALMLMIGNRGGGKTFLCGGILMVAIALALPGAYQIGVSITSKQNREIKEAIRLVAAPEWIQSDVEDFRDPHTDFITGSRALWLTSKNPKALRQALLPFEHVLINEGQDQKEVVFTNSISAIRSGGLVTVASNPPQEAAGDWVAVLHQGIEAGSRDGQAFLLDSAQNAAVSQPTLSKIGRLLQLVNPSAYEADALGLIRLSGNVGYPGFSRMARVEKDGHWVAGHVGLPIELGPPGVAWQDVTREITAEQTNSDTGTDYVGGGDFQTDPGSCAPVGKIYRTPTGELVLWIREFVATRGTEQDLTIALNERGYYPGPVDHDGNPAASLLLVGDATGARQNAEHRKHDPYSFTRLRADGWTVLPPYYYGKQRTPMNPRVEDSRKQMKALFSTGKLLLSPACVDTPEGFPSLIESFVRAKVNTSGKFEKKRHYTHGPDGVRYLAWRFLPRSIPRALPSDPATMDELQKIRVFGRG